jgi:hypothetical protein
MSVRDYTFNGLSKWYVKMVEKFGWIIVSNGKMTLADADDKSHYATKITSYISGLKSLSKKLVEGSSSFADLDRKHDCKVMLSHLEYIKTAAKTLLGVSASELGGGAKKRSKKSSKRTSKK